jgi:hypothetical protein
MSDFAEWMKVMGYNGKQVTEAAAMIGIENRFTASNTFRDKRALSKAERLAMSAVRAGLKEWTPENDVQSSALSGTNHSAIGRAMSEINEMIQRAVDERLAARASGK